ncbi:unnamed protein product [Closterium sp. Naga37s-1]|nr:unnamed protein product [Closterium sp. Naga37s-1]
MGNVFVCDEVVTAGDIEYSVSQVGPLLVSLSPALTSMLLATSTLLASVPLRRVASLKRTSVQGKVRVHLCAAAAEDNGGGGESDGTGKAPQVGVRKMGQYGDVWVDGDAATTATADNLSLLSLPSLMCARHFHSPMGCHTGKALQVEVRERGQHGDVWVDGDVATTARIILKHV